MKERTRSLFDSRQVQALPLKRNSEEETAVAMSLGPRVPAPKVRACSPCLETVWTMGQSSSDLGTRRRARIGYDGDLEQ